MAAAEQQQRNAWIGIAFSAKPVLVKTAYQQVYVLVAVLAVFATVLPLWLMAEGLKRIGANQVRWSAASARWPPWTSPGCFSAKR